MKSLALAALIGVLATPVLAQNAAQIERAMGGASCPHCNLFQINLGNKTLDGRNYAGSRLRQADMSLSVFSGDNFTDADLRDVNAYGALFSSADLRRADLTNATFVGAYLGPARGKFRGANLDGAKLDGVNFSGAELDRAVGLKQSQLSRACGDESTKLPRGLHLPACK